MRAVLPEDRRNQKSFDLQIACQRNGGKADRLRNTFFAPGELISGFEDSFGFLGDLGHDFNRVHRIIPGGGFLGQHERVGAVQDRRWRYRQPRPESARGFCTIERNIWVAVMTGLPR